LFWISYGDVVGVSVGGAAVVGVSDGGRTVFVGVAVGVEVGVGGSVGVGVDEGTVGMGRLRLSATRFSTSVLSPIKVRRSEMIPFVKFDTFHE
jgi:hypothetical protein